VTPKAIPGVKPKPTVREEKVDLVTFTESDTVEDAVRRHKRAERKVLREALGITLGELMIGADFETLTRDLWTVDDTKNRIGHQVRATVQNRLLRRSPYWGEIKALRKSKESDRKEIAKLIKKASKELGYEENEITKQRDLALAQHTTYQLMDIMKNEIAKALTGELIKMPLWNGYLQHVVGISTLTASKLIYLVKDVTRFSQPSKLLKYSGLAVTDGKPDRPKRGVELNYNPELKALLLGVIGDNFIKSKSQYRVIYDRRKAYTAQHRPEWGINPKTKKENYKAHYHADARRIMVKRFVTEFWKAGYLAAGLEVPTQPYAVRILGHDLEEDVVSYVPQDE